MTLILTSSEPVPTGQMAPIALLPNEILIAIFKHGLNELPESARSPSFRKITASVCKAWHDVVLRSPELWTRVFVTLTTPVEHLQTCIERSGSLQLDLDICHFVFDPLNCPSCPERFLIAVLDLIRCHSHRLRSLTLWNIPDVAVDMIWKRFRNIRGPVLTDISVKNRPHSHVRLPTVPLFPFLDGHTPKLTNMEIDFPFMIHNVDVKLFNLPVLTYLTLRTRECPLIGYSLPPYLIEFSTFCALLRTTPNLAHLALYGPVIEPDEDFPNRPPPVTLPALKTLIIHRREPGVRYHAEFLSVLTAPHLAHLELPWHDELRVELPRQDCTGYLFGAEGAPRFPLVRRLCLHDSAVEWKLPAVSFIRAFPLVEDVMLGGTDVETFAATLRRSAVVVAKPKFVDYGAGPVAWPCVRKLTLRSVHMHSWKRCAAFLCEWLAARGCCDKGCVRVEVERCSVPPARLRAFMKCLDRLRPYAQVAYRDVF
ncbi:hypothetical protein F5I97DRAFT_1929726 [Phlebopus sp. FC_14]|nr:hypothetical protein F5I97DRAFT_1929726 [Phlebopus sp. FC_14]